MAARKNFCRFRDGGRSSITTFPTADCSLGREIGSVLRKWLFTLRMVTLAWPVLLACRATGTDLDLGAWIDQRFSSRAALQIAPSGNETRTGVAPAPSIDESADFHRGRLGAFRNERSFALRARIARLRSLSVASRESRRRSGCVPGETPSDQSTSIGSRERANEACSEGTCR